jgi:hypothetical protein
MLFDVIGAVELTASAAIVVAVVSIGFGADAGARRRIAAVLAAWFVAVVALAATKALSDTGRGIGVQGLGLAVIVPFALLTLAILRLPSLRRQLESVPLSWLTAVHAVRVLGVSFVLLYAAGRLPAPFAPVAGWGDIAIGLAALPVAWLVHHRATGWRGALLTWNTLGLLDLATAVTLGVLSSPGPLRLIHTPTDSGLVSTLPWLIIPGFLVPLLAVTHIALFHRLRSHAGVPARTEADHGLVSA